MRIKEDMTSRSKGSVGTQRASVLGAIQSPLKFLALSILVFEALLSPLVFRADGANFSILLAGMLILIFGLLASSLFIIVKRPDVLRDRDVKLEDELRAAKASASYAGSEAEKALDSLESCKEEVERLQFSNKALQTRVDTLTSLRNRLIAVIHGSDSVSQHEIFRALGADTNPTLREDTLALLVILIDERKVARASLSGYYRAVESS